MNYIPYEQQDFLMHYGILGQKWGVRRYQNKDGSLTEAGRARYLTDSGKLNDKGKKRFVDRGDGTYYDATKFARKFGLVGGLIDTARLVKEKKYSAAKEAEKEETEREKKLREEEQRKKETAKINNEVFTKQMAKSGWTSETYEYGTGSTVYSTSKKNFGPKEVRITASYDSNNAEISPERTCSLATKMRDKYTNEYKKVLSTTTETIAKDMYDSGRFMDWHGDDPKYNSWTRQEFKKNLQNMIQSVNLNTEFAETLEDVAYSQVNFYGDGNYKDLFGGHMLTTEYDIYKDKTYHGTQMNG